MIALLAGRGGRCDSVNLDNNNNQFNYIVN